MRGSISLGCLTPSILYRVGESGLEGALADVLSSDPLLRRLIHPINPRAIRTYELLDEHETPNFMDDMARGGLQAHFNVCWTLYRERIMREHGLFFGYSGLMLKSLMVCESTPFTKSPNLKQVVEWAEECCDGEIVASPAEVAAQQWEELYGQHLEGRGLTCVAPGPYVYNDRIIRCGQFFLRNALSCSPVFRLLEAARRPWAVIEDSECLYAPLGFITNDEEIAACGTRAYAQAFGDGNFNNADPVIRYCVEKNILKHQPIDDWRPEWIELLLR